MATLTHPPAITTVSMHAETANSIAPYALLYVVPDVINAMMHASLVTVVPPTHTVTVPRHAMLNRFLWTIKEILLKLGKRL